MNFWSASCTSKARLDGKVAIITGANTGIGKETAKDFYQRGAKVIIACRNVKAANEAVEDIKKQCESLENLGSLHVEHLDLANLQSVRDCAKNIMEKEEQINLLVNNAGVMICPLLRTDDGFEMQFGTNHLGHFLFTLLLLPKIIKSTPARIVIVSSSVHNVGFIDLDDLNWNKRQYSAFKSYFASKLANVLFCQELAARLKDAGIEGVNVYSLHPGVIKTELDRHMNETVFRGSRWIGRTLFGMFLKTPKQGAQTTIYCSVDEKCANETGLYYAECSATRPGNNTKDIETQKKLWEESLKLVGLPLDYNPFI